MSVRRLKPKARYLIRSFAKSERARRGEVLVRSMRIWSNDPHYAAVELFRLTRSSENLTVSRCRYECLDFGEELRGLGVVVSYDELVRRAGSLVTREVAS